MPFCTNCGREGKEGEMFCTECGAPLPDGTPSSNIQTNNGVIILGYLCSIFFPIIGIIFGIYLLTRPNKDVHIHGIIMIILSITMFIVWWLFWSYMAYLQMEKQRSDMAYYEFSSQFYDPRFYYSGP